MVQTLPCRSQPRSVGMPAMSDQIPIVCDMTDAPDTGTVPAVIAVVLIGAQHTEVG